MIFNKKMLTSLIVLRVKIVTMYQTCAMLETVGPGLNGVLTRLVVAPTQMVDAVVTLDGNPDWLWKTDGCGLCPRVPHCSKPDPGVCARIPDNSESKSAMTKIGWVPEFQPNSKGGVTTCTYDSTKFDTMDMVNAWKTNCGEDEAYNTVVQNFCLQTSTDCPNRPYHTKTNGEVLLSLNLLVKMEISVDHGSIINRSRST